MVILDPKKLLKGGSIDINFKLRVFCTTKVYQILKFSFSLTPKGQLNFTTFQYPINNSLQPRKALVAV